MVAAVKRSAHSSSAAFILDAEIVPIATLAAGAVAEARAETEEGAAGGVAAADGAVASGSGAGGGGGGAGAGGGSSLLSFQTLSTRKRKHVTEANAASSSTAVKIVLFDMLYYADAASPAEAAIASDAADCRGGGRSLPDGPLLSYPFIERRARLRGTFETLPHVVEFAQSVDVAVYSDGAAGGEARGETSGETSGGGGGGGGGDGGGGECRLKGPQSRRCNRDARGLPMS